MFDIQKRGKIESLQKVFPNIEELRKMSLFSIGNLIFEILRADPPTYWQNGEHPASSFQFPGDIHFLKFCPPQNHEEHQELEGIFGDGWHRLEHNGVIKPKTSQDSSIKVLTKKGKQILEGMDMLKAMGQEFPEERLHPIILSKCRSSFLDGNFSDAVFSALKQLEIKVRNSSGIDAYGFELMRRAFNSDNGPLRDKNENEASRREGLRDLFVGVFKYYRNENAHKNASYESKEASEILLFASHLMGVVERISEKQNQE